MALKHPLEQFIHDGLNQFNRSIHETLYPALDAFWLDNNILVKVDLAGFAGKEVEVELKHNFLIINAERDSIEKVMESKGKDVDIIYAHRPLNVHARILLPFIPNDDDDDKMQPCVSEVTLVNGVLTVKVINFPKDIVHSPK